MTVISQDDHLTAGAWAACVLTSLSPIVAVLLSSRDKLSERASCVTTTKKATQETITILIEQAISFISQRNIMFLSILSSFRFRKMGSDEQLQFAIVI